MDNFLTPNEDPETGLARRVHQAVEQRDREIATRAEQYLERHSPAASAFSLAEQEPRAARAAPMEPDAAPNEFVQFVQREQRRQQMAYAPLLSSWVGDSSENAALSAADVNALVDFEGMARTRIRERHSLLDEISASVVDLGVYPVQGMRLYEAARVEQRDLRAFSALTAAVQTLNNGGVISPADLEGDPRSRRRIFNALQGMSEEERLAYLANEARGFLDNVAHRDAIQAVLRAYQQERGDVSWAYTSTATDIRDVSDFMEWATINGVPFLANMAVLLGVGSIPGVGPVAAMALSTGMSIGGQVSEIAGERLLTAQDLSRVTTVGAVSGASEIVLGSVARFLGTSVAPRITQRLFGEVPQEVVEQSARSYFRALGREVPANFVEEFLQEGFQSVLEQYGVRGDDFAFDQETFLQAFNEALAGGFTGGVFGGGVAGVRTYRIRQAERRLNEGTRTEGYLRRMAESVQQMAMPGAAPSKFRELAARLGFDRMNVFYQASDIQQRAEQTNTPLSEMLQRFGITEADYQAALDMGGSVQISGEHLAVSMADPENAEWIATHGVMTPTGIQASEASTFKERLKEIEDKIRDLEAADRMQPDVSEIYNRVYGELRAAGQGQRQAEANAALTTAFFETVGARYGADGAEIFRRYGFNVQGPRQMARAEAAAEAAQLQIPDEVVSVISDAVAQADAGGPVTLQVTPEVTRALQTLGVQIDDTGTINPADVQRLTAAIQALEDVVPRQTIGRLFEQASLVDEKNRVAELRRSVSELRAFAEQQSSWRDWYDTYQSMLEDMFGQDADLFRQILAATSQAASVPANVGLAIKAYEQMLSGQPFTGYLPAVIKNLDRIRAEVALSGRKIGQYGAAVTGDEDGIAIDRHVAMIMFDTKNPTAAQVELGKQTVRDIAAQLGWKPREVQAALWAANIVRSGKEPQSYDTYLIRKADQIRAIREAFPAPVAGRGDTGAGAGGAVDPGAAEGRTFEQGPVSTPDTSVAGGLTEKSFIKTRSLLGARIIPMFADLTDAGSVFDALDGMPITPTAYFGGPNFSWLRAYRDAGIVWAFNAEGVITGLRNKVRALKAQSLAEGGDGRVVITMLAMKEDAHTSNEMTINALLRTLDAVVEAGRFPPEQLAKAKDLITSKSGKADDGYGELATFPGFGDAQALHDWIRGATFTGRKALATEMRSAAFQQLPGMFPVERIVREAVDPDYRATQQGDALLAFEIDPDAPDLIIDWDERAGLAADLKEKLDKAKTKYTQKEIDDNVSAQIVAKYGKDVTEAEQNPDIPRHPAYRYGMRGTLVGSFSTHIPMEVLYGDLLAEVIAGADPRSNPKFLMDRLGGALDQQVVGEKKNVGKTEFKLETGAMTDARLSVSLQATADAEPQVLISGQDYTFRQVKIKNAKSAFVTLSTPLPAGSVLRMYADAQSQLITEDVVRQAEAIEGLQDYRIAQAYTAGIAGQWRSSDEATNKGGIAPVEFVRALVENNAAATLTQYTEDDIKEGKKDKSLRVFQLGTETVQDGGLNVWMAVKTGLDYRKKYPGDVTSALVEQGILTDNETALVGVVSNELGVRGMATFQVLKGIEEGVTVLNAYKVKSEAKPDGLLPTIYATLGFEEVGEIQFDPQDFDDQQLADLKAIWTRQGWNEADGFPAVAIMKWRGDDALRSTATERFIAQGQDGLGIGGEPDVGQVDAEAASVFDGAEPSDQGDGVAGAGDGRADPRSYADRARGVSGRARDFVDNLLAADQRAIDALKLPQDLVDRIRSTYGQGRTLEQRPEGAGPRGSITFPNGGLEGKEATIRLFQSADQSTFAHEAGHFFLEAFKQIANDPAAPMEMLRDYQQINEWLGRDKNSTEPYTTEQQETWARGFEAYLMEGKAPSNHLRRAFSRFKAWLTQIYKTVANLRVELTPEIVEVMDRMLATDGQLADARAEMAIDPLSSSAPPGMSASDYEVYRKLAENANSEAERQLLKITMAKLRAERTREYRDRKKALLAEAMDQVMARQEQKLLLRLQEENGPQLNLEELKEVFGDDTVKKLSRSRLGGKRAVYAPGGMALDMVADLAGYRSAAAMIEALTSAQPPKIAVEALVSQQLNEEFAEAFSPQSLQRAALDAIHNDERGFQLTAEGRAIAKQAADAGTPIKSEITIDEVRQEAKEAILLMSTKQATNPLAFLNAERKAAREAEVALRRVAQHAAGRKMKSTPAASLALAHAAKRRQLLAHFMYREAVKGEKVLKSLQKAAKRLAKKATRGAIGSPYIERIDALLEQYDFRQRGPGQVARDNKLAEFIKAMEDAGRGGELAIPDRIAANVKKTHYSKVPLEQLMELRDSIANIENLGRRTMQLVDAREQRDYLKVKQSVLQAINENLPDARRTARNETVNQTRSRLTLQSILNSVLTADTIIANLDGNRGGVGPVWDALKRRISEGAARYEARRVVENSKIAALFEQHFTKQQLGELNSKREFVPELNRVMTRGEMLALALNSGNTTNWSRFDGDFPPGGAKAALETRLTEQDWRFVQSVWDYLESFWPEIAAHEKLVTGVVPTRVVAEPQVRPYAFVKGGYYPIRYDARLSATVEAQDHKQIFDRLQQGKFGKAQTRHGHTEERVAEGKLPGRTVMLSLGMISQHVNDVVMDLELRQPVTHVHRLLNDEDVVQLLLRKGREDDRRALNMWVQDVANGDRWAQGGWDRLLQYTRTGLSISVMAASVTTIVQQPLGLTQSIVTVGGGNLVKALLKYARNPSQMSQAVQTASPFMLERQRSFQRDILLMHRAMQENEALGKLSRVQQLITTFGFYLIQKLQFHTVDMPTWVAAHDRALRQGKDPQAALTEADQILARTQGSGLLLDRTAWERGTFTENQRGSKLAQVMTAFGSYMFAKFSLATQRVRGTDIKDPIELLKLSGDLALMFAFESILAAVVTGRLPDFEDEDEDPFLWWTTKQAMLSVSAGVPILRDAGSVFEGWGGGGTYASAVETVVGTATGAYDLAAILAGLEDEDRARAAVKDLVSGTGLLLHLPASQVNRALTAMFEEDMSFRDDFRAMDLFLGRRDD